ncbi:uncharacterized protein LOC113312911 [Papaver somniferum]|uniref:uncharacterized protein LOC113312911 n=1 Tax=Papaver somniferum TaxID=3469 RepID=UPI000E700471|nr:uncharacterized protein LOC113312911 [Papaver somniferum]
MTLPEVSGGVDKMAWNGDIKGNFTTSASVEKIRLKEPKVSWPSFIWKPFLHPSIASNIWKIQHQLYVDDEVMRKNGYNIVYRCCICVAEQDSMDHTLWKCEFNVSVWNWICVIFGFNKPKSFGDICKAAQQKSPLIKEVWMTAAFTIMRDLWFQKNQKLFEEKSPQLNDFKRKIWKFVHEGSLRMKGTRWGQVYDKNIIDFFHMGIRFSKYSSIKECYWSAPEFGVLLFCCDDSSIGNPGEAGFGIIVRYHECQVVGTMSRGIGTTTNYLAEVFAVICALEWAIALSATKVIIRSDYKVVIHDLCNNNIPWALKTRWMNVVQKMESIVFQHIFTEANFSADDLTKRGVGIGAGERIVHNGRPNFIKRVEMPKIVFYRFC